MRARAFTIIELLAVIAAVLVLIVVLFVPFATRTRCGNRQLKDSLQLRGTLQAVTVWAQSNKDNLPLPSLLDLNDATVKEGQAAAPELGVRKDISRHLFSLLLFNGYVPPEMLVSPAESNPQIRVFEDYEYTAPSRAEGNPAKALWDPAFSATPADENRFGRTPGDNAGLSYAHAPLHGKQLAKWPGSAASFNAAAPVLSNRGPVFSGTAAAGWTPIPGPFGRDSNTNLIHGNRNTWEGCVAFADGHVDIISDPAPPTLLFSFTGLPATRQNRPDCIFANEDDQSGVQLPADPPSIIPNTAPDSGGRYTDPSAGDMTTAYLRPIAKADWLNGKAVLTAFVD